MKFQRPPYHRLMDHLVVCHSCAISQRIHTHTHTHTLLWHQDTFCWLFCLPEGKIRPIASCVHVPLIVQETRHACLRRALCSHWNQEVGNWPSCTQAGSWEASLQNTANLSFFVSGAFCFWCVMHMPRVELLSSSLSLLLLKAHRHFTLLSVVEENWTRAVVQMLTFCPLSPFAKCGSCCTCFVTSSLQ